jgi:hypothetical protein
MISRANILIIKEEDEWGGWYSIWCNDIVICKDLTKERALKMLGNYLTKL